MAISEVVGDLEVSNPFSNIILPQAAEISEPIQQIPVLPEDLFSWPPEKGAFILQKYLDTLPESERYTAFEPLVRKHWKWLCKAAPHLKFAEPMPLLEGQQINIGFKTWGLTHGGAERQISLLASHLANDPRYHVTLFINENQAGKLDYPIDPKITVKFIKANFNNWAKIIKEHPLDLIVLHENWNAENYINILLCKLLGLRVLAHECNVICCQNPFRNFQEKLAYAQPLYSCCGAVSCLSGFDLTEWRKNGVPNSIFVPNPPTFNPDLITPSTLESNNILWVGRWDPGQKRPEMAIEVFAKVLQKIPNARLTMAGAIQSRRCHRQCLRRIRELGIGHAVDIVGFQKDMVPIYSNGALLMSTSRFEGWGNMIMEAKAFGLPVVSTAMPYLETLKRGAIQTPPNDVDALAEAIVDLLQNPEKRRRLGEEARQDVLKNFSSEIVFAKYEALIEAILTGPDAVAKLCTAEPLMDAEAAEKILADEAKA
ncbi:MAG: glycosyltransferase, partial [Puniceicoccales bacterium]|nr:glycosyltransferase [Puniceicoccales bacterium]